MLMTRLSEGTSQMQIEAYRMENARLLSMLATTEEYKEFAQLAMDSGSVRFMDPIAPATSTQVRPGTAEKEDWIPEDAYKIAHEFRNKCASNISKAMMNQMLTDLNKVWRQRENKQIQRIKSQMTREIESLRRGLAQKKPYVQHLQDQEVKRLKQELKDAN